MGSDAVIGEVGDGFGEGTEIWRRLAPAHGEDEGESHQGFFTGKRREGDAENGHVGRAQPDAVEPIR
jgi:hypothetical protein